MPLFGRNKKKPNPAETISKLKETIELLEKREQFLQRKIDTQTAEAKKHLQNNNKKGTYSLNI